MATLHLSQLAHDAADFDVSDERSLRALHAAEVSHFWHRARNELIVERLAALSVRPPAAIVDLGCGSGAVTAHLHRAGYRTVGIDGHRTLIAEAERRAPTAEWWTHDLALGIEALPRRDFGAAALFDVVEHLERPIDAIEAALALVEPRGVVVGTVPALMSLWSPVDERAGHRVRYDVRSLRELLACVRGARLLELQPFFRSLVPLLWVQRRLLARGHGSALSEQNLAVPRWPLNALLHRLCTLERRLPLRNVPGASLWFALRRE